MTHKEFAARWRATLRGRVLLCAVMLAVMLGPIFAGLRWFENADLFRLAESDTQPAQPTLTRNGPNAYTYTYPPVAIPHFILSRRAIYLTASLYLVYILLVALAFVLCARHLFRRYGFVCPGCDRTFDGWNLRHILSGGHCCFCGERVLEEDPPRPPDRAMQ